nr:hypothetical protein [Tanacetum cinerariifolium]
EETREEEEESFDPIPRTPEDSEDDGNGEKDQGLRQESSSVSSFVTSMLNLISDASVESIFTSASSSVAPLPTPIPTMTPFIITTITTASHPPIPPTPIPNVNINQGRGLQGTLEVEGTHVTLTPVKPDGMESIFETTSQINVQTPTSVAPLPITTPTMTSSTIATTTTTSQAPILPT